MDRILMTIEDMQHLAVIDAMAQEIYRQLNWYNELANGLVEKRALCELRLKQNHELTEILRQQRRALHYHLGLPYEPETHQAEVVMIGTGEGAL